MNLPQSTSHLHGHQSEDAFNSLVQSPLRISSLSGGPLHSRWAGWWPRTGACPTAKTKARGGGVARLQVLGLPVAQIHAAQGGKRPAFKVSLSPSPKHRTPYGCLASA